MGYKIKRFSVFSLEDRFFGEDEYDNEGRRKDSNGWVAPTLIGSGLAAGGFYGARKGMLGEGLQKSANNAWGSLGNALGNQGMIDSAANDYVKGLEGDAATKAKNEFLDKHKIVEEQQAAPQTQQNSNGNQTQQNQTQQNQTQQNQTQQKKGRGEKYRRYRQQQKGGKTPQPKNTTPNKGGGFFGSIFGGVKKGLKKAGSGLKTGVAYIGKSMKNIGQKIVNSNAYGSGPTITTTYTPTVKVDNLKNPSQNHAGLKSSVKNGEYLPSVMKKERLVREKVHGPVYTKKDRERDIANYKKSKEEKARIGRERAKEIAIQREQQKKAKLVNQQKAAIEKRGNLVENFDLSKYQNRGTPISRVKSYKPVSDPRAEYAARQARKAAGAQAYAAKGFKRVIKRGRRFSDTISYRIPRFSQRLFADSEKKDSGMGTLGKVTMGLAATAATYHGARHGMLGNTMRRATNTLHGNIGKYIGSQRMMDSAAVNYAKGDIQKPSMYKRLTSQSTRQQYDADLKKSAEGFMNNLNKPSTTTTQPATQQPATGGSTTTTTTQPVNTTTNQGTFPQSVVDSQYGF